MKVAYRGQLDAIDQWLRDINNKLTMGISPTFLLNDCQKMQTDLREVAEKIKHEYPFYSQTLPGIGDNLFRPDPFNYGLMALNVAAFGELFIIVQHLVREPVDMRFWQDIHPRIIEVSKELFCNGHFAAASESAIKEVETRMRELFKKGKPNSPTPKDARNFPTPPPLRECSQWLFPPPRDSCNSPYRQNNHKRKKQTKTI